MGKQANDVQKYEFKAVMDRYLATIPNAPNKTVAQIVASGKFYTCKCGPEHCRGKIRSAYFSANEL